MAGLFSSETLGTDSLEASDAAIYEAAATTEVAPKATICDSLSRRIGRSSNWVDAFTALLFMVALSAAIMLAVAVFSATDERFVAAAGSGVGAVLSSGGFLALLKLRSEQQKELAKFVALAKKTGCQL